jgi:NhaC family Na+:H+ antiporter
LAEASADNPTLSPALALLPVAFLVLCLSGSVYLFGADASYGPNQIALVLTICVAALVARRVGIPWRVVEEGMVHGITLSLGPVMILLAVGMLIGAWILSGTVPTMIYYGIQILNPTFFYAASALLCAIVAISIGSSWTVAGTLGIGLMGIAGSFGLSPAIAAGAIISGAYFGDKLSPMSDTTNLAAATTGVDLFEHIRHMLWTTLPAFTIALVIFMVLGSAHGATPVEVEELTRNLQEQFDVGLHLLLPLVVMLGMAYRRLPAFPAIVASALLGALLALLFQPDNVIALAGEAGGLPRAMLLLKGIAVSLFDGYAADSGNAFLDELLSKGGMSSMLNTVWLILCALGLGGVMERVGILGYLLSLALRGVKSTGSLVATTVATCIGANVLAADQFMAIAIPGRMYRQAYERQGLSRLNLSRTLEDAGTLTSPLVPWNTCGAYMSATLGVSTYSYLGYAWFNLLCPLIAIIYAYRNVAQKPLEHGATRGAVR